MEIVRVETKINPLRRGGESKSVGTSYKDCIFCGGRVSDRFKVLISRKNDSKMRTIIVCAKHGNMRGGSGLLLWGGKVRHTKSHSLLSCCYPGCKNKAAGGIWLSSELKKPIFMQGSKPIDVRTYVTSYCSDCFITKLAKVDESIFED